MQRDGCDAPFSATYRLDSHCVLSRDQIVMETRYAVECKQYLPFLVKEEKMGGLTSVTCVVHGYDLVTPRGQRHGC